MDALGQVFRRLQLLIAQGRTLLVGSTRVQVRGLDEEVITALRVEPYGLSYRALPGGEAYVVFPGGDRAQGLALIVGDRRYQVELEPGEVALHDDLGNMVRLRRGGVVEVVASAKVKLTAPRVEVSGRLVVAGGAEITGAMMCNGVDVSDAHTHTCHGEGQLTSEVTHVAPDPD